MLDPEYTQVN